MTLQFCEVNADQSAPLPLGPGSIPATVSNSTNKVRNFYFNEGQKYYFNSVESYNEQCNFLHRFKLAPKQVGCSIYISP